MFCTDCGHQMQSTDVYCAECGHKTGTQSSQTSSQRPRPRLKRSMTDKKIAGVCSGLARQYDWDVTLVRLAFLLGIVFHGVGLLVYVLAWITMPSDSMATANLNYGA
jgi:phage shock protein C